MWDSGFLHRRTRPWSGLRQEYSTWRCAESPFLLFGLAGFIEEVHKIASKKGGHVHARRIFTICAIAFLSAGPADAQGPRQLTASEFRMNDQGMIVMTSLVIDRYLLAARSRDATGGAYWRAGGFTSPRDFGLVEERVLAYLQIMYLNSVASVFSGEEQAALAKRANDLRAARDRRWSDVNLPGPESTSDFLNMNLTDIPKGSVRILKVIGQGLPTIENRRNRDEPVTWLPMNAEGTLLSSAGTVLRTPRDVGVILGLPDGSVISVYEETIINLEDLSQRPRFRVEDGKVTAKVKSRPADDAAASGALGMVLLTLYSQTESQHTEFTVSFNRRTGVSITSVSEGSVQVTNLATGATVNVPRGKRVEVTERRISDLRDDNQPPSATSVSTGSLLGSIAAQILGRVRPEGLSREEVTTNPGGNSWSATAVEYRGRNGERFRFSCPADGTIGRVWGSDIYTDDSSVCSAAVHAGRISAFSGGAAVIIIRAGASSYSGSTRRGVTSQAFGGWYGSFQFANDPADDYVLPSPSGSANAGGNGWNATATEYRGRNGERFRFTCPAGGTVGRVWGSDIYTDDSLVCSAATHAGLISTEVGGTVVIEVRPGASSYQATARNGVTSSAFGTWYGSFVFVH
jgi:hypothetical protein